MKVKGITAATAIAIGEDLDILLNWTHYEENIFKLRTRYSSYYCRFGNLVCFHGFRDFILACFAAGATQVKTSVGTWHTLTEFRFALPTIMASSTAWQQCEHSIKPLPAMHRRYEELKKELTPLH